ncbi:MAG: multidrug/biocide efflux PACE transporter [Pseudomonadota bacterium]
MNTHRSIKERFFHALGFEVLAIAICAPLGAWLLDRPLAHMGLLTLMISLMAMAWNMVFNAAFDRAQQRMGFRRTLLARAVHAVLFEIGLLIAVVPLAAWWLSISLWHAFVLDIGIVLFFLPYTFGFNWTYDYLREAILRKRKARAKLKRCPASKAVATNERSPANG